MIDKKLKNELLKLSGIAIAQNMTLEELLGRDGTIITAKFHGDKADLKAMPLSETKDLLHSIQEMLENLDKDHCKFCGNKLTFRVERGYVEEYDFKKGTKERNEESIRTDTEIDTHEYGYCDYCDTHFHDGLILDGRNDLSKSVEIFYDKFKSTIIEDPLKFLNSFEVINMSIPDVMKIRNVIVGHYF